MDEVREMTCIVCPVGCRLAVEVRDGKAVVSGHQCSKGVEYGEQEALDPRRTVTSSVLVIGGESPLASVRTSGPVPKVKIMDVMAEIRAASVTAPVKAGSVVIHDVAETGSDVIATRDVAVE